MREPEYSEFEICKLFDGARHKGEQIGILAELSCVSREQILEILERNGRNIDLPEIRMALENKTRKSRDVVYERYKHFFELGYTPTEISKEFGISPKGVREYLRKHGFLPPYKQKKKTAP